MTGSSLLLHSWSYSCLAGSLLALHRATCRWQRSHRQRLPGLCHGWWAVLYLAVLLIGPAVLMGLNLRGSHLPLPSPPEHLPGTHLNVAQSRDGGLIALGGASGQVRVIGTDGHRFAAVPRRPQQAAISHMALHRKKGRAAEAPIHLALAMSDGQNPCV